MRQTATVSNFLRDYDYDTILVKVENVLYFLHLKPHTIEAVRNDDKKGRVMAVADGLCMTDG